MKLDQEKLKKLVKTLSDDQKQLLREGLAQGDNLDAGKLADAFGSAENRTTLHTLSDEPGLTRW